MMMTCLSCRPSRQLRQVGVVILLTRSVSTIPAHKVNNFFPGAAPQWGYSAFQLRKCGERKKSERREVWRNLAREHQLRGTGYLAVNLPSVEGYKIWDWCHRLSLEMGSQGRY
ncbi:hypothetical protein B0T25DRAFT_26160 [Lasiosphaeria hispida]|uniref:Uncharacterized protein n=1 Tax=Lasiosphaeria hispida TaxID=260671 RepID=A0AAJ0HU71_9PEZI|nr:hypothetical protein B0T25DRAFT_26160 [Lasiosphaeria hispida]